MARSFRSHHALTAVAAALLTAVAACSAPSPPTVDPPSVPSAVSATGPFAVYTFEEPEHRSPAPIVWHAESGTFFVGTMHDGTIYRGRPDDPSVRVFLEGQPGQMASGIGIAGGRLVMANGMYGDIRVYDVETRRRVREFATGPGGLFYGIHVTPAGDVWVADALRPVLWHLTPDQVAAGTGTPAALPLGPEIPHISSPDNVEGVVALSETRLVVVKYADGALYRIDLDPQAPQGRTITGATVPLGSQMILDGSG